MTRSCEERIASQLESTLEMLDPDCQQCQEEGYCEDHICGQDLLSIDSVKVYSLVMTTGGPHKEFLVHVNDGRIEDIFFKFMDWFDGASRRLTGDDRQLVENWIYSQVYLEELE